MDGAIGGMVGLFGGMIFGALGWWFGRQKAKKNRGLDEFNRHIRQTARATSWFFTLGAMYLFFSLHLFGVKMSLAMVLALLILVHVGSWGIIAVALTVNMSIPEPLKVSRMVIGVFIIVVTTLTFTIITIIMKNPLILALSILPNVLGLYIILSRKKEVLE